ncbi:molybdenum cofactor guanylyltransferase MobA [Aestuariispira ectoiniformans]|uniref:molybdenum cofactor guanylyltransferase MobA n=1 Tax=Aestuariispira ectoiniformans TaxID=2775080 RepID=UPI00223BDDB1|nr:molybdenum cofactor guanylyltransferase MobA [Aestuariispira ectoiniformans]
MTETVIGVVLAGGLARRMGGGDKCLLELAGQPILKHILDRLAPQVDEVVLNVNGAPTRFDGFGLPVVPDVVDGFSGPLAGVLTGLDWAAEHRPDAQWIVTVPGDGPFLPRTLVADCLDAIAREQADMAVACSNERAQPVVGLWPVRLREDLRHALVDEEIRKVDRWTARYRLADVTFEGHGIDPFFNANRPEDLAEAEAYLQGVSD